MKKILFVILFFPLLAVAQTVTEGQFTLIYSLPKTEFEITADVERITETPGEFYQYSERYLATSDVITSKRVYFRLKSLQLTPKTVADPDRTYTIIPSKRSLISLLTVNDQGILCGINVPPSKIEKDVQIERKSNKPVRSTKKLLPLTVEYMLAGSVAKMAEGAARHIYRIRENKVDLLAGDVEYVPTDGASMKTMIEQMDEQEKELTNLFTGTTTVENITQKITFVPTEGVNDKILFRFSSFEGVVSADDLSGEPYYISINYNPIKVEPVEKKRRVKEEVLTIIPVSAQVSLFIMDKKSRAYVRPVTGRLLTIEKNL